MGLCHSSHKYRLRDQSGPDSPLRPLNEKAGRVNHGKFEDPTEASTTEGDLDTTMPLSPDSMLSPGSDSLPKSNLRRNMNLPDESAGGDKPIDLTEEKKNLAIQAFEKFSYSFEAKNTRKGRALKARLQKAHLRQMILSSPTSNHDTMSEAGSFASFLDCGSDTDDDSSLGGLPSLRFSMSSERTRRNNSLNDEFEASFNKGMIWAELEQEDKVLAVALSRQTPTLEQSSPPLFLAVGGQNGRVSVTELLEGGPLISRTAAAARLGATVSMERKSRIRALDFSPTGQFLAVAGDDGVCAILGLSFNVEDQLSQLTISQEIRRMDRVYAVQFSPDGRFLAIGGYDDSVAIVSVPDASIVSEIPTDGLVLSLDWRPDGHYLAIGGSDKRCLIVDARQDWSIACEIRRPASIQTLQWHPKGGKYLAIGSSDVAILDGDSFQIRHELGARGKVSSGSSRKNDALWNINQSRGHNSAVYRVLNLCWSPTGGYLVVNSSDGQCKLFETKSYSAIQDIQRSGQITSVVWGQHSVIAGVPHRYIAMGGEDKKVVILKAGIEMSGGTSSIRDDISSSAESYISNRGDWVLKDNVFRDLDEGALTTMNSTRNPKQTGGVVQALAFSRGSKSRPSAFFALATGDGIVTIRSTLGWKILAQLEFLFPTTSLAFSNGSRMLAMGGQDGKLRIVATSPIWSVITEVNAEASVNCMAFSKNNERLVIGAADGALIFLNPQQNFSVLTECEENESAVISIDWCTRYMACGRADGSLTIYESDRILRGNYIPESTIEGTEALQAVAFGGNGKFLAVATCGGMISIYSAAGSWVLMHELKAEFSVTSLKWSPNGRHLAFTGEGDNFKIMDTVFWAAIERNDAPSETVGKSRNSSLLSFSQDGKFLARVCGKSGTRVLNTSTWDTVLNLQTDFSEDSDGSSLSTPPGSLSDE
jgi:WD40 repeat protein